MMYLLNILRWDINLLLAAVILMVLLPFSSHQKMRYYGCYAVYIYFCSLSAVIFGPFFVLFRPRDVRNNVITAEVLKYVSNLVGIQWEHRGADILGEERGAVIVSNHQSMFDILGLFTVWKTMGKCAAVTKKELFYFWPFGLGAWSTGTVFVDRNRPRAAVSQLDDASRLVTQEKTKLWIFPEGTRNKNPETLLPFKKGAFRVAVECQVPIIPVVFSPYYFIDSEKKYFGQGRVIMHCMEPVSTEGKTEKDIDSIMEEVREKMMKQLELLRKEVLVNK